MSDAEQSQNVAICCLYFVLLNRVAFTQDQATLKVTQKMQWNMMSNMLF